MCGKFERIKVRAQEELPFILEMNVKMKLFILAIVCAVQVSYQNPISNWSLQPNILVVKVDGTVGHLPLSCLASPKEHITNNSDTYGDVYWMKNGEKESQSGNSYSVQLEESLGGGNYTCHREDGSLLNHTVVLIQEDETQRKKIFVKNDQDEYLKCLAHNFNGEFHCSWTWHKSRVGTVAFIQVQRAFDGGDTQCSADASGRHWTCSSAQSNFKCSVDDRGHGILCTDEQHCPFAEEIRKIHISVLVMTEQFLVENYSKQFFLSEIVKPDKVAISKVNNSVIEWSYPSSWSSPFSYFPLTFQIAQLKGRCKRCANPCSRSKATKTITFDSPDICQLEVKSFKAVCIRAKDALCNSQWSEWSHFRLRNKNKKKKHRQKEYKKE